MISKKIPRALEQPANKQVLSHIERLSAHSDVAEALANALKPLGDVQVYGPDWQTNRYVVASTNGLIFALAVGVNTVGLRLDERMKARALVCRAERYAELGDQWIAFALFRDDWPKVDLEFWARKAYVAARS